MDTGASYVIAPIYTTTSFEMNMRIQKVGGPEKGPLSDALDMLP